MADAYPLQVRGDQIIGGSRDPDGTYEVKRYDFKRPDKFSLEQIQTFRLIHQVVARMLTATISTTIGRPAEVTVADVDQLTYQEFLDSVPEKSAFAAVKLSPLRGPIVMELDGALASLLVTAASGQRPESLTMAAPEQPLTEIETLVLESVVDELLPAVKHSWKTVIELAPSVAAIENNRRDVMIVPPTEMIILASLAVRMGDEQAFLNIAVPFLTIEPIIGKLSARYWYSTVRRGRGGVPELGSRAAEIAVDCELSVPLEALPVAELPAVLHGAPLPLESLYAGTARLIAGSVAVADVAMDAANLEREQLELEIVDRGKSRAASSRTDAGPSPEGVVRALDPLLERINGELRELRLAFEESREDRESTYAQEIGVTSRTGLSEAAGPQIENPNDVAILVSSERPETVAFLLAPLEPQSAARVLAALPANLRDDTVRALTTLEAADLQLHARVLTFLGRRIQTTRESSAAGGPPAVAEILNHVPRSVEKAVMERFMNEDKALFESIAQLMFVFEDFVLVDPSAIRKVAERVTPEELALAMKGVAKEVVSHILNALSDEHVAQVEAAEASIGRTRRADVEAAQREIIEELRRLEEEGEVVIARPDEVVE